MELKPAGGKNKRWHRFFVCTCAYAQNVPVSLRVLADGAPTTRETKKERNKERNKEKNKEL